MATAGENPAAAGTAVTPLGYEAADRQARHSPFGVAALALAMVAPVTLGLAVAATQMGWRDPPPRMQPLLLTIMYGGPFVALLLGIAGMCHRGRRRWPAAVAVVVCVPMLFLFGLAFFTSLL